jgi:hypothetical protein
VRNHPYLFLKILVKLKILKKVTIISPNMNFNIDETLKSPVQKRVSAPFDGLGMYQGVSFLIKEALRCQIYWNEEETNHPVVVLETQGRKFKIRCPVMANGSLYHLTEEGKKPVTITGYKQVLMDCS